jgi:TPR repeat protein
MKPTANIGAQTPFPPSGGPFGAGAVLPSGLDGEPGPEASAEHDPAAKALLRRYLSEVHSFREMGNQALRNLEARLATLPPETAPAAGTPATPAATRAAASSHLVKPLLAKAEGKSRSDPTLSQRLNELSAYLHADLSRESEARRERAAPELPPSPVTVRPVRPQGAPPPPPLRSEPADGPLRGPQIHKIPTLPVLDRAWFEARFAALRASIDKVTQEVPLKRIEMLEGQFRELMERLTLRENARDPRPLEQSLRELATYLADSRQWQAANEQRVRGMEDRLDRISDLVAQSHAAISATARGLEVVAKGTGDNLARATASLIISGLGERIERNNPADRLDKLDRQMAALSGSQAVGQLEALRKEMAQIVRTHPGERLDQLGRDVAELARNNPAERIDQLGREVAHLSAQTRMASRNTEDRLEQIETTLKDKARAAAAMQGQMTHGPAAEMAEATPSSHDELESYLTTSQPDDTEDDYDSDMIAAAQRAARLADGPARHAPSRPEPARYQIPYGDFLPEDDSPAPRAGLIIAVAILLLAGATMLFLKAKEWTLVEPKSAPVAEEHRQTGALGAATQAPLASAHATTASAADAAAPAPAEESRPLAVVTGSTPSAPVLGGKPLQLWVAANAPDGAQPAQPAPAPEPDKAASLREAAIGGDLEAQFAVGQSYLAATDGEALSASERLGKAMRWFRRAAEGGHTLSQYRLATLLELGQGGQRNLDEAEQWYERAAKQGHVKAMHNLAVLAVSPARGSVNYLTASKWFREAADYGLTDSQFNLGVLYERGLGLSRSMEEAYYWYALAARQKDAKGVLKRDEIGRQLSAAERLIADQRVAAWTAKTRPGEINRTSADASAAASADSKPAAPAAATRATAPAAMPAPARAYVPALAPKPMPSAAVIGAAWKSEPLPQAVKPTASAARIAEAQRMLKQMGYDPGPIDGVPGPRTEAAIRAYQRRAGVEPTGVVTEGLIVKMAFLPL